MARGAEPVIFRSDVTGIAIEADYVAKLIVLTGEPIDQLIGEYVHS